MISKLLKKLQITTRRITDDPRAARRTAWMAGLCAAVVSFQVSVMADYPVRHAVYQQSAVSIGSGASNLVPTSLDSAAAPIQQVSYQAADVPVSKFTNVSSTSSVSYSTSKSGKQVKWVSASSPEARTVRDTEVVPASLSADGADNRVEPIPTVVPCRPRIRPVQGTEHSLLPGADEDTGTLPLALPDDSELPAPAVDGDLPGIDGLNVLSAPDTSALPSMDGSLEDSGIEMPSEIEEPGAIGSKKRNQGGLEDAKGAADSLNDSGKLPTQMPKSDEEYDYIPEPSAQDMTLDIANAENFNCPRPKDMKAIRDITNDITAPGANFPPDCPLTAAGEVFPTRQFAGTNVTWTASNLCHNPLYFEQPALERYGHTCGPLQPVLSGAQFLLTVPALPYLIAMDPVNECQYPLGHYRPGSCAPYKWNPFPYSTRAAVAEGGIVTALVFLIP